MSFVFLLTDTHTLSRLREMRSNGIQRGKVSQSHRSSFYSSTSSYELLTDLFLAVNCLYLGTATQQFLPNSGSKRQTFTMIIRLRSFLNKWYVANLTENSALSYDVLKKPNSLVWVHNDH